MFLRQKKFLDRKLYAILEKIETEENCEAFNSCVLTICVYLQVVQTTTLFHRRQECVFLSRGYRKRRLSFTGTDVLFRKKNIV